MPEDQPEDQPAARSQQQNLSLDQWLDWIQLQHPVEIDMGLHRVSEVARRLGLIAAAASDKADSAVAPRVAPLVITVAGTNGKGSCVAMLDAILREAGYRAGTYTSPHLLRYNERVTLLGTPASDEHFCAAFRQICAVQGVISLSFFEYGTLAALLILQQAELDIAILEVGLGGRLDAVNIIDADIAVISSIDLDHQDWLGETRELIGREKAGIFRTGRPAVCGEQDMPQSIDDHARALGTPLLQQGLDYAVTQDGQRWSWRGQGQGGPIELADLPHPGLDLVNASTVLQALQLLPRPPDLAAIERGLAGVTLPGRFQHLRDPRGGPEVIVDVAHNPHAGRMLASKLHALRVSSDGLRRIHLLLAMMHDKDQQGFFATLEKNVDIWYIAHFPQPRCLGAAELLALLERSQPTAENDRGGDAGHAPDLRGPFPDLAQAYEQARANCETGDIIVATGSFFTVAGIMQLIGVQAHASASERQD